MDKKNSQLEGFDYPDLDLSDQEPPRKQDNEDVPSGNPTKKTKIDESISKNNQVQANKTDKQQSTSRPQAPFFPPPPPGAPNKNTSSWLPPPPINQKPSYNQPQSYQRQQHHNKNHYQQKYENKQKKNTVYVKNIPKSYSTQDKLMTFFKNEGPIKQIKVNQVEQSAVIKFVKEEHAAKFFKSNKIIFNRSYIVYGENEYINVTPQQIQDRINDELGNVKKAEKTNMKVLKEKVSNELSQNIRALYFLQNYLLDDGSEQSNIMKSQLQKQIDGKIQSKRLLEAENIEDFRTQDHNTSNYNWSLIFVRKSNNGIDRKAMFAEFLKYGPIISLDYECISQKSAQTQGQNQQNQEAPKPYLDYRIKLTFLGIKNAWQVYKAKSQQIAITMQGKQIQKYFQSGKLKTVQPKKTRQTEHGQGQGSQSVSYENKTSNQAIQKLQDPADSTNKHVQQAQEEPAVCK